MTDADRIPRCLHADTFGAADCVYCGPFVNRIAQLTAERDALQAQVAALEKKLAEAERIGYTHA